MIASIAVDHIVASIAEEAAGPSYTVPRLCHALAARGTCDVSLHSVGGEASQVSHDGWRHQCHRQTWQGIPLLQSLRMSRPLRRSLAVSKASIFHGHGIWLMPNIYPSWAAARSRKPFVVSPRGMLGESALKFSSAKKAAMWRLMQKNALEKAACFHATSEKEYEDIRRQGLRQPIAIIPNGIDIPELDRLSSTKESLITYIGRIHPKKNIEALVKAWGEIEKTHLDWRLQIIGPDEGGYLDKLKRMASSLLLQRIVFKGPVYGSEKTRAYQKSDLFVLPTLNENFGMVVAEALANAVPVICSRGAPWAGLDSERCGWWVDNDASSIAKSLNDAIQTAPSERQAMGERGRAWMIRDFSWQPIAADMEALYNWQCGKSERPGCVRLA